MRSYLDTLPRAVRSIHGVAVEVVLCPADGELPEDLEPVEIDSNVMVLLESLHQGKKIRTLTAEKAENENEERAPLPRPQTGERQPSEGPPTHLALDRALEWPLRPVNEGGDGCESGLSIRLRSLQEVQIAAADWAWKAPAARCRSCGAVIWLVSLAGGLRMLVNPRHHAACTAPPSALEAKAAACPE